jgi:hypothetical protein
MAQTGYLAETVFFRFSADWKNRQKLENSKAFATSSQGLAQTLLALKEVEKSRDIDLIVMVEATLINMEQASYGTKDITVRSSLEAAAVDLADIKAAIVTVKSPKAYQAASTTHRSNKKERGVVIDGCHEAINGHITRLGNSIRAIGVPRPEKSILSQRQVNMRVVKELYIELQAKALGIAVSNNNDRGR